jgi:glycine hydroxymethyltransferase
MMGKDFNNPWQRTTKKGNIIKMSSILNSGVFPGMQGGPLEHVIAAKAVAFKESLDDSFKKYGKQVIKNANAMAESFVDKGYNIVSGGTDNHLMLIDLRSKNVNGKEAEKALVNAEITVNKNMVPFDDKSPFVTSGIRIGTAAITTRGLKSKDCRQIVEWIDEILSDHTNEDKINKIKSEVKNLMSNFPLYQ